MIFIIKQIQGVYKEEGSFDLFNDGLHSASCNLSLDLKYASGLVPID